MSGGTRIRFGKTEEAYDDFTLLLKRLIKEFGCSSVADVGGGAEPQLSPSEVRAMGIDYTLIDISAEELALAPPGYRTLVMDIAGRLPDEHEVYDFLFSRFVLEHVTNAESAHRNVFAMLKPGGIAVHLFPTLYASPFLANKLLPESLTVRLLSKKRQERGKFPAHYHWCRGPSVRSVTRLEEIGYRALEYSGFYGHGYFDGVPFLRECQVWWRDWLLKKKIVWGTSFAWVILQKPAREQGGP